MADFITSAKSKTALLADVKVKIFDEVRKGAITPLVEGQILGDLVETLFSETSASTNIRLSIDPAPSGGDITIEHQAGDIWVRNGVWYQLNSSRTVYENKFSVNGAAGVSPKVYFADDANNSTLTSGITTDPAGKKFMVIYLPTSDASGFEPLKAQDRWLPLFGVYKVGDHVTSSGGAGITNLAVDMTIDFPANPVAWTGALNVNEIKNLTLGAKTVVRLKSNYNTWTTAGTNIGFNANSNLMNNVGIIAAIGTIIRPAGQTVNTYMVVSTYPNNTFIDRNYSGSAQANTLTFEKLNEDTIGGLINHNTLVSGTNYLTATVNGVANIPIRVERRGGLFRSGVMIDLEIKCVKVGATPTLILQFIPVV